jgi:hypothetical protein
LLWRVSEHPPASSMLICFGSINIYHIIFEDEGREVSWIEKPVAMSDRLMEELRPPHVARGSKS